MGQARVARRGLEGVADRVAVVEDVAQLGLALVALDDRGLQAARSGDDRLEHPELTRAQRCEVALELGEVSRVQYDPVLDDLGEPGTELALGQRARHRRVDDHQPGLVEGADQVLGQGMVDRGLASDGGVDLGEHRGRELDDVDAAHIGRRREAGHVTHGAAAERQHRGGSVQTSRQQLVPTALGDLQGLGALALGDLDRRHREPRRLEARGHGLAVEPADGRVADQRGAGAQPELAQA